MTTPDSPDGLRAELSSVEAQIAELQRVVDDARRDLADTSDKSAAIEGAEQQEVLIGQLELRRRDLMERLDRA
jgi:septal ring factor EnvC (AmiA/AmiB activator)